MNIADIDGQLLDEAPLLAERSSLLVTDTDGVAEAHAETDGEAELDLVIARSVAVAETQGCVEREREGEPVGLRLSPPRGEGVGAVDALPPPPAEEEGLREEEEQLLAEAETEALPCEDRDARGDQVAETVEEIETLAEAERENDALTVAARSDADPDGEAEAQPVLEAEAARAEAVTRKLPVPLPPLALPLPDSDAEVHGEAVGESVGLEVREARGEPEPEGLGETEGENDEENEALVEVEVEGDGDAEDVPLSIAVPVAPLRLPLGVPLGDCDTDPVTEAHEVEDGLAIPLRDGEALALGLRVFAMVRVPEPPVALPEADTDGQPVEEGVGRGEREELPQAQLELDTEAEAVEVCEGRALRLPLGHAVTRMEGEGVCDAVLQVLRDGETEALRLALVQPVGDAEPRAEKEAEAQ